MKADENPFRSSAVAQLRYRVDETEKEGLIARLREHAWRGCLLGPEGTGKTTLLEDMQPQLEAAGINVTWVRLTLESKPEERRMAFRHVERLQPGQTCFFDGGEVLGWLGWRRLIKTARTSGCGLFATVHRPCPLPVVYETRTNLSQTLSLAAELAGDLWNEEMAVLAKAAFQESQGNTREVFRACYWHCAMRSA